MWFGLSFLIILVYPPFILGTCSCADITVKGFGPLCQGLAHRHHSLKEEIWSTPICWVNEPSSCRDVTYGNGIFRVKKRFSADACKGK